MLSFEIDDARTPALVEAALWESDADNRERRLGGVVRIARRRRRERVKESLCHGGSETLEVVCEWVTGNNLTGSGWRGCQKKKRIALPVNLQQESFWLRDSGSGKRQRGGKKIFFF